jgi:alkaline phosphatase
MDLDIGRGGGRVDMAIMNIIGFDASAIGNHEFDPGTSAFADIINAEGGDGVIESIGATFPYLWSNLDFSADSNLAALHDAMIADSASYDESLADLAAGNIGPAIAPATTIDVNGEPIGVVGATTQLIESISSTGAVDETTGGVNDMAALAAVIQAQIDTLIGDGVNKIIVTSHLQQIELEKELAGLLDGVDIIIAGGSNTLQADAQDTLRDGDVAAESYPFLTADASGNDVAIVSTDGEYSYVGRLVVDFDDNGNLIASSIDETVSGAVATDENGVLDVTGAATLEEAINNSVRADIVQDLTEAVQSIVEAADSVLFGAHDVFLDGRRESVRTEETKLGNLTADANLAVAREADDTVTVSFKNGGGIRAEIGSATDTGTNEGDGFVSQLDLQNSLRFNNDLTLVTLTSEGFSMLLEHAVSATDTAAGNTPGQFLQIGGFRVSFDESGTAQQLATDADGDYILDPATGMPEVAVEGSRIQTVALIDPETGEETIIMRDGELTEAAPTEIRMVTLDFLVENNGDGYPFQELATDIAYVTQDGAITTDPSASNILEEQEALGNHMAANHPDADSAFSMAETDVFNDARIVQLALNGGIDRILLDENDPQLDVSNNITLADNPVEGTSEVITIEDGRAFVTDGENDQIDIFDMNTGALVTSVELTSVVANYDGIQSVSVKNGIVAAAISTTPEDGNGVVALFDTDGTLLNTVEVGNLPDMLTFTPDGQRILVANEGEPTDTSNPMGGVSIIDLTGGVDSATAETLDFTAFDALADTLAADGVLLEPGVAPSMDLEPEYITVLPGGETAWVSLQEANAYAVIDLTSNTITDVRSFGTVDRSQPGFEIDASNDDNAINLQNYENLVGMRQPDAITSAEINGEIYVFTANEGDARDNSEADIEDLVLDSSAFPNADLLQQEVNLGNLEVRNDIGDTDGDGDFDVLYHYGARSFTIYNESGDVVFDSGSTIPQLIAEIRPELFNADDGEFDGRSDNKGVEPEAIAVGEVNGRTFLFVGLERDNGIMVFDVTDPTAPVFDQYIEGETNGNLSPEIIQFIPAEESSSGGEQIAVSYEVSGTSVVYDLLDGADQAVNGTPTGNEVLGGNGNDTLQAKAGDDIVFGNGGGDTINGGLGNDSVDGGAGSDNIKGFIGSDMLQGAGGDDSIQGNSGDDMIEGGAGNDDINSGIGDDYVIGGDGDDDIFLFVGNDTADGGAGSDTITGAAGDDSIDGGAGDDVINTGVGNDAALGRDGNDSINLNAGDDMANGGEGDDVVSGNAGNDDLIGGAGSDTLDGGIGNDTLEGGQGDDLLIGGFGDDVFVFDLEAGVGNDRVNSFQQGVDLIQIVGANFDDLTIANTAGGTLITHGEDSVFVASNAQSDFTEADFIF